MGAIATLVDEIGAAVIHEEGNPMDVSVDMSISYMSHANINVSPDCLLFLIPVNNRFWMAFNPNGEA